MDNLSLTSLSERKKDDCLFVSQNEPLSNISLKTTNFDVSLDLSDASWTNEIVEIHHIPARKVRYTRYEHFAKFINAMYPNNRNILSVGCGLGEETYLLSKLGYNVTGIDSHSCNPHYDINFKVQTFTLDTDIMDYDLITGLHCCSATEKIIRNCLKHDKEFVVTLCEVNPGLQKPDIVTRKQYIDYLKGISSKLKLTILPIYEPITCEMWGETIYYKKKI